MFRTSDQARVVGSMHASWLPCRLLTCCLLLGVGDGEAVAAGRACWDGQLLIEKQLPVLLPRGAALQAPLPAPPCLLTRPRARCPSPVPSCLALQWFASVEGFRGAALEAIEGVSWIPATGTCGPRIRPAAAEPPVARAGQPG